MGLPWPPGPGTSFSNGAGTRSLNEICEIVPLNDFVVTKVVWGLLAVGALMRA